MKPQFYVGNRFESRGVQSVFQANEERDRAMAERRRLALGDAYEQAGRGMPSNVREAIGGAP